MLYENPGTRLTYMLLVTLLVDFPLFVAPVASFFDPSFSVGAFAINYLILWANVSGMAVFAYFLVFMVAVMRTLAPPIKHPAVKVKVNRDLPEESSTPEVRPRNRAGYVYLLRSESGLYKIGRTRDPQDRLRTFNVKLPFDVAFEHLIKSDDMFALEKELHDRFSAKRVRAEWFKLDDSDVAYIKSLSGDQEG